MRMDIYLIFMMIHKIIRYSIQNQKAARPLGAFEPIYGGHHT